MKICDKCRDTRKRAEFFLVEQREKTEYDFCAECRDAFFTFLAPAPAQPKAEEPAVNEVPADLKPPEEKRGPGRPRKDVA